MKQEVYARYRKKHWLLRWVYRLFGVLLLWTSVTMPKSVQLTETPLVKKIQSEYPTWHTVFQDIIITTLILGVISILLNTFLKYAQQHRLSKKVISRLKHLDNRASSHLLAFLFFVVRWSVGIGIAILFWHTGMNILPAAFPDTFRLPTYADQPVVFVMGILGLTFIIESIDLWQQKMRRYIHLRY